MAFTGNPTTMCGTDGAPLLTPRCLQELDELQHRESVQAAALLEVQVSGSREQGPEAGTRDALGPDTRNFLAEPEPADQGAGSSSDVTLHADGEDEEEEVSLVEDGWGYPDNIEYM